MKKMIFMFILFFSSLSSAFSIEYYSSNVIGQRGNILSIYSVERVEGYILAVDGSTESLYLNGKMIKKTEYETEISSDSDESSSSVRYEYVTVTDYTNGTVYKYTYQDKLLVHAETRKRGSILEENLIYSDNSLVCISKFLNGENTSITYYLRSAYDGSLMGVRTYNSDSLLLFGEDYYYEEESLYRDVGNNFIKGDFQVSESGDITFTREGITYTYSNAGKLLKTVDDKSVTTYFYDDELNLVYTVCVSGNTEIRDYYSKTNQTTPQSETTFVNGVINEEISFTKDGMIKSVYSNGVKVGTVYYEPDNLRIKKVVYERSNRY